MALPIYQPYSTVQNSFNQLTGQSPISYNSPLTSLRYDQPSVQINTLGNQSNDQKIQTLAQTQANKITAQQRAGQIAYGNQWNQTLSLLPKLNVDRNTADNIYDSAYNMGYTNQAGPSYVGQQSHGTPGSTEFKAYEANRGLNAANNQGNLLLSGIDPTEVQKSYQKFLQNNQF